MIRIVDSTPPATSPAGQPGSHEPFREIVESMSEAVWLARLVDATICYVNPAYELLWGRSRASLYEAPQSWLQVVHEDDREQAKRAAAAAAEAETCECEYRIVRPDGAMRWIRHRGFPVLSGSAEQCRYACIAEDVTELHQAQSECAAACEASRQDLDRWFTPGMNPMFIGGFDGRVKRVNRAAEIISGFSAAEIMSAPMLNLVHPDDRAAASAELQTLAAGGTTAAIEFRVVCRDGSYKWTHWSATPFADQGVFYAVGYDVSDRHAAEAALAERQEEIRTLLDSLAEGVFGTDLDGKCTFVNAACLRLLGYGAPEDLLGKTMHDVMHHSYPDGTPMPREQCQVCRASREDRGAHVSDEVIWRRDGTSFPAEYFSHPIRKRGEAIGCVVSFLDISLRVKAARERDRFFNHPLTPMCVLGFDGRFKNMNPVCGGMFGYSRDEMLGQLFLDAVHPDDRDRAKAVVQAIVGGASQDYEIRIRCKDGTYKWMAWSAVPFADQQAFYAVGHDVTARRIAEESLAERARQQQAVAELGSRALAGGDLAALMNDAATVLARTLGVEFSEVLELQAGEKEFLLEAGTGWNENQIGQMRVSADVETVSGYLLAHKAPVIVEDLRREDRFRGTPQLHEQRAVSGMACLIPGKERPYGVLAVHSPRPRSFSQHDVLFLESVANILAAATERRRAEEELERFFDPSLNAMFVAGFDGRIKKCNHALELLSGYSREELLASPLVSFTHPDDRQFVSDTLQRVAAGESAAAFEIRIACKDGSEKRVLWNAKPFADWQVIYSTGQDVTDRHRAAAALAERARQQEAVAELGARALAGADLDSILNEAVSVLAQTLQVQFSTYLELQPGGRELLFKAGFGWPAELIGHARMTPDPQLLCGYALDSERPVVVDNLAHETRFQPHPLAVSHGVVSEMACLVPGGDCAGGVLCVHSTEPRRFASDDVHFVQAVANIVAAAVERRRAEEELNRFFEPSLNPMFICGYDGVINRYNPAIELLTGASREELLSQSIASFVHPDDRPSVVAEIQKLVAGGQTESFSCRVMHKDGSHRWILWNAKPFPEYQAFYATGQDVTDQRLAEEALRRQADLLNLTHDAIVVRDMEDRITFWNFGAEERYGWTAAEAVGQVTYRLLQTQFPQPREQILDELHATGRWEGELAHATRDGRRIFVASRWSLERDRRGAPIGILEINNDVTARKAAEDALRASEETLRATGESALDGIIRLDPEGNVAQWNAAAERMFGYTSEEILGRNLHDMLVPAEAREQYMRGWPPFRESGQGPVIGKVLELEALRKDGGRFPVEVSVAAVSLHGRWNAVGIVRDITTRKRAEAELLAAKSAAESANRSKSEFLANMSHEIRTPMNGVIGLTSLVLDTPLSKEQRQYLDGVMLSAEALLKIINDILDFSKIEAGRLELEKLDFDLRETLENTIRTLALRAHEKGLELLCDVLPEAPDALVGDPARLWQVLVNLVGNAIKFTQEGEVSVTVAVESLDNKEVCLRFTVADTGIGIPADKQQALFKPFSQVDSSMTRKYGGTGLGLAISAQIVELMKGRIWFESELGKGSKFHFTACFEQRTTPLPKRAPLPPSGLDGLRVLVVDDNATNRVILRNMLTHWGMRPEEAEGGNAALQMLRDAHQTNDPFGLILLDVMMPVMDGFEVLERIRQIPEINRPVIMMLSSRDEPGDAARAREAGVAAYIVKPIRPSDLLDAIVKTLGVAFEAAGEPPASADSPVAAAEPCGPSLRVLVAEDNPINQMLAVRILEKAGHSVAVSNNGEEALVAVGRETFDIVLMDVQMPVMDGFEATALIRQQEKTTGRHLPIVAMTAHAMKGDREKCLEAGMDGYVAKPVQKGELFAAIAAAITNKTPAASC